jgi:hypothetical protein
MGLDYTVKKPKDLSKINVNDSGELLWWSYILGVSMEKILTTVEETGTSSAQVKAAISGK